MEKIIKIEEGSFKKESENDAEYDGYIISTNKQTINIGIYNSQRCCERWGYLTTNDDISDFIGAKLIDISITDTLLNNKPIEEIDLNGDECSAMFVNINTNKGLFQIVAYNKHNGYYGHEAVVISNQLNHEERL